MFPQVDEKNIFCEELYNNGSGVLWISILKNWKVKKIKMLFDGKDKEKFSINGELASDEESKKMLWKILEYVNEFIIYKNANIDSVRQKRKVIVDDLLNRISYDFNHLEKLSIHFTTSLWYHHSSTVNVFILSELMNSQIFFYSF